MRALRRSITTATLLAASLPLAARAQTSGDGYLFRNPRFSVSLRGGLALPSAKSDVFAFTSEQLTVDRGDFKSITFGGDLGMRVLSSTHVVLSIDGAGTAHHSEFRDYIDNNDLPIEQTTKFSRLHLTMGVKQYLSKPGRSIGQFAWVPARIAPFVGAGAGTMYYDFHQYGDFIDFQDMDVFTSQFRSSGWTPTFHGLAGFELSLTPHVALIGQGRYDWSKAELSRDFSGFDRIDLAGFTTTVGLTVRF